MYSNIAFASSIRLFHFFRLSISICIEARKGPIIALSSPWPIVPKEGITPETPILFVKDQEVNWASLDRHVEGVDDHVGVLNRVNRPAHVPSAERVDYTAAENLPFSRGMLCDVSDPQLARGGETSDSLSHRP